MAETDAITLQVRRSNEDTGAVENIGQIAFHPGGVLTLLTADPAYREALDSMILATNARETFRINVPPPGDAPQFSLYAMDVDRGDADLLQVVKDFIAQRYGFVLNGTS